MQADGMCCNGGWGVKTMIVGSVVCAVAEFALATALATGAKGPGALRG